MIFTGAQIPLNFDEWNSTPFKLFVQVKAKTQRSWQCNSHIKTLSVVKTNHFIKILTDGEIKFFKRFVFLEFRELSIQWRIKYVK